MHTLPEKTYGEFSDAVIDDQKATNFIDLNARLNLYDENGNLQLDQDKAAAREYFLQYINPNTVYFGNLHEKLGYLTTHGYYDHELLNSYDFEDIKALFQDAYAYKHRFPSFIGALKFYTQYALKTSDGTRFLERYEDRICMTALYLAQGDIERAELIMREIIEGRFQPATPTFINAGLADRGGKVSCFPAGTPVLTSKGEKAIEDVSEEDLVLTHSGQWKAVEKLIVNPGDEELVTVTVAGLDPITMTGEHPVMVISQPADKRRTPTASDRPSRDFRWVYARDLNDEDIVVTTIPHVVDLLDLAGSEAEELEVTESRVSKADYPPLKRNVVSTDFLVHLMQAYHEYGRIDEDKIIFDVSRNDGLLLRTMVEVAFGYTPALERSGHDHQLTLDSPLVIKYLTTFCGNPDPAVEVANFGGVPVSCLRTVQSVDHLEPNGDKVYNLEVADDHTYHAGGITVHNCFLLHGSDNMESITKLVSHSLQLSKRGGGVGINLTNLRESGSAIKGVAGAASGVVPVMKILEDCFSYANQLGARQGAGAVYLSCHHPDIMAALDTKRENADEKVRIKTLSIGIVVSDVAFRLARENKDMYLFSPADVMKVTGKEMTSMSVTEHYDEWVEDPRISKKKVGARQFFQTIAELQFESGYPYLLFEDTVNEHHHIPGRVSFSNLCSEIVQVSTPSTYNEAGEHEVEGRDISCNLGSLNVAKAIRTGKLSNTVDTSIRALTQVSDLSNLTIVPTVRNGNEKSHAVGLGAMNLHGFLGSEKIHYGSEDALDFVNCFFAAVRFHALSTSADIAAERGETFYDYEKSGYAPDSEGRIPALVNYTTGVWPTTPQTQRIKDMAQEYDLEFPDVHDWKKLEERIAENGLYHAYLLAVAPTGSISYCTHSTSSIHPIPSLIEIRKEGKLGRVYSAAPGMTTETIPYFTDAYVLGPEAVIDTYAVAQKHVDQAQSLTLFFPDTASTRDLNKAYVYAFSKGKRKNEFGEPELYDPRTSWKTGFIKSLYYTRLRQQALSGSEVQDCVSCTI